MQGEGQGQGREWHGAALRSHDHDIQGPALLCANSQGLHQAPPSTIPSQAWPTHLKARLTPVVNYKRTESSRSCGTTRAALYCYYGMYGTL